MTPVAIVVVRQLRRDVRGNSCVISWRLRCVFEDVDKTSDGRHRAGREARRLPASGRGKSSVISLGFDLTYSDSAASAVRRRAESAARASLDILRVRRYGGYPSLFFVRRLAIRNWLQATSTFALRASAFAKATADKTVDILRLSLLAGLAGRGSWSGAVHLRAARYGGHCSHAGWLATRSSRVRRAKGGGAARI